MAISYPLSMPASPTAFQRLSLMAQTAVGISASEFTFQQQVVAWQGDMWIVEATCAPMKRAEADPWRAFFDSLRGQYGTFYLGDAIGKTARGIATGTPLLVGAHAAGLRTLATNGWTASQTGIMLAGDYIQVGTGATTRLHRVLVNANSDGTGAATLEIFPALREALADDAPITVSNCKGVFRLAKPPSVDTDEAKFFYISFSAREAL